MAQSSQRGWSHTGKSLETPFLISIVKYDQEKEWEEEKRGLGRGVRAATLPPVPGSPFAHPCPLHVPPRPPRRTDGRSGLAPQPPPFPAASTARTSQSPDFYPWRGTHRLSVQVINPAQLKQQEPEGCAVPALRQSRPRLPRYHLGRELAEQEQDRYRSGAPPQGIPGIRAGARRGFLFHFEEGTISLDVELPFHSQKFFSHFLTESRARSKPSLPPTHPPPQPRL